MSDLQTRNSLVLRRVNRVVSVPFCSAHVWSSRRAESATADRQGYRRRKKRQEAPATAVARLRGGPFAKKLAEPQCLLSRGGFGSLP